jgi:hypothetical protein
MNRIRGYTMSKEIENNTIEYLGSKDRKGLKQKFYVYLNTGTGQLFSQDKEIIRTKNVKHLVRVKALDFNVGLETSNWSGDCGVFIDGVIVGLDKHELPEDTERIRDSYYGGKLARQTLKEIE